MKIAIWCSRLFITFTRDFGHLRNVLNKKEAFLYNNIDFTSSRLLILHRR